MFFWMLSVVIENVKNFVELSMLIEVVGMMFSTEKF